MNVATDRQALIESILDVAEAQDKARFVPVQRFLLKGTDGKFYGDFPRGVKWDGSTKQEYWVLMSAREGTTHGTRHETLEALETLRAKHLAGRRAEFREQLDLMTEAEIDSQADYWLKR